MSTTPNEQIPELLTYAEAAKLLHCSVVTLQRAVRRNAIGHIKVGPRKVRFSRDQIAAYLKRVSPKRR